MSILINLRNISSREFKMCVYLQSLISLFFGKRSWRKLTFQHFGIKSNKIFSHSLFSLFSVIICIYLLIRSYVHATRAEVTSAWTLDEETEQMSCDCAPPLWYECIRSFCHLCTYFYACISYMYFVQIIFVHVTVSTYWQAVWRLSSYLATRKFQVLHWNDKNLNIQQYMATS